MALNRPRISKASLLHPTHGTNARALRARLGFGADGQRQRFAKRLDDLARTLAVDLRVPLGVRSYHTGETITFSKHGYVTHDCSDGGMKVERGGDPLDRFTPHTLQSCTNFPEVDLTAEENEVFPCPPIYCGDPSLDPVPNPAYPGPGEPPMIPAPPAPVCFDLAAALWACFRCDNPLDPEHCPDMCDCLASAGDPSVPRQCEVCIDVPCCTCESFCEDDHPDKFSVPPFDKIAQIPIRDPATCENVWHKIAIIDERETPGPCPAMPNRNDPDHDAPNVQGH